MHYHSITVSGVKAKPGYYHMTALSRQGASSSFVNGAGALTVNDVLGMQKLYGARAGSQPKCNDPVTQKPYFFENTMQGYFSSKVASEYGTTCRLENRICRNGQLSGSFRERECQELCITGDGKTLRVFEKIKAFGKNTTANDPNYGKYEEHEIECRVAGGIAVLDKNGVLARIARSKDFYLTKPTETPPVVGYTWQAASYGSCSATPSYSYGAWSACTSNSTQTRSAQCVNTTGMQSRNVVCRSSTGVVVADSLCSTQAKPLGLTNCTASCAGSPNTSQSCQYVEPCPVGTCQSVGAKSTFFVPSTQVNVRVQSGQSKEVLGNNRADVNVIVSKGAAVVYNDQPGTKRVYFEGSARDYSLGKGGNAFQIKDACGNISSFTIGQDLGIKFIFSDGIQEFRIVPGSNAFRYVSQGVLQITISVAPGEFMRLGYSYLDSTVTSRSFFSGACRM